MNNKNLKTFLFIITSLFSISAFAGGWTSISKIDNLNTYSSFVLVRIPPAAFLNPDNCSTADNYYHLSTSHALFKEIYSTLLAAKVSNSDVNFWLNGCNGGTTNGRPVISTAIIR